MTAELNEAVVQRVNDLGSIPWSGETYRHTTAGRDPLSGVGARLNGGRWNPRDVCSTVYLATPIQTCISEFVRMAEANHIDPLRMLRARRSIHTIQVHDVAVLDLRSSDALSYVGLSAEDIADDDWTGCQSVGHAAHFLEMGGVVAPSATGSGFVVAIFEGRAGPAQLTVSATVDFDEAAFRAGGSV